MPNDIGIDIKAAYQEVGEAYTIDRAIPVTGEYLLVEAGRQSYRPFLYEYVMEASLPYDTQANSGDVLLLDNFGPWMIMSMSPEVIENQVVEWASVVYMANVSGEISRPSGEAWGSDYHKQSVFTPIKTNAYGLLLEAGAGDVLREEAYGEIPLRADRLYIPHSYGLQLLDRYSPVSGENYIVDTINLRQYDGIDLAFLKIDTR